MKGEVIVLGKEGGSIGRSSDNSICNPDKESVKLAKDFDGTIIGRLDGTSYYDFTKENLQNFLVLRDKKTAFHLSKIIPEFAYNSSVTKLLNRRLDRTSLWLMNNADGLIFQSQLSLKMHQKFLSFDPEKKRPHLPSCLPPRHRATLRLDGVRRQASSPSLDGYGYQLSRSWHHVLLLLSSRMWHQGLVA